MSFLADTLPDKSPWAQAVRRQVEASASLDAPVLLTGPAGSGKSHLAGVLHQASSRSAAPIVTLDAALLPGTLFHGEAFGHGAGGMLRGVGAAIGALRAAGPGTVVIENVDRLSPEAQRDLAVALERRAVVPLGMDAPVPFAARVLATSELEIAAEATAGRFDPALATILLAGEIRVASLADRREDLESLIAHFARESGIAGGEAWLTPAAIEWMRAYVWPGNVGELKTLIARLAASGRPRIGRAAVRRLLAPDLSPWSADHRYVERTRFPGLASQRSARGACRSTADASNCRR